MYERMEPIDVVFISIFNGGLHKIRAGQGGDRCYGCPDGCGLKLSLEKPPENNPGFFFFLAAT